MVAQCWRRCVIVFRFAAFGSIVWHLVPLLLLARIMHDKFVAVNAV